MEKEHLVLVLCPPESDGSYSQVVDLSSRLEIHVASPEDAGDKPRWVIVIGPHVIRLLPSVDPDREVLEGKAPDPGVVALRETQPAVPDDLHSSSILVATRSRTFLIPIVSLSSSSSGASDA